jgi:hypothetical protein
MLFGVVGRRYLLAANGAGQFHSLLLCKRRRAKDVLALDDDVAPPLRTRDRVVQKSALVLDIAPHLVRPDDDDALEFAILSLLNRHRYEGMRSAPTILPAQCHVPRDNGFDLLPSKGCAPNCVDLIVEPAYRRSRWPGARSGRKAAQASEAVGAAGSCNAPTMTWVSSRSVPSQCGIRSILMLSIGAVRYPCYHRLRKAGRSLADKRPV